MLDYLFLVFIASVGAGNLKARFENMAKASDEENKKRADEERARRLAREKREREEAQRRQEVHICLDSFKYRNAHCTTIHNPPTHTQQTFLFYTLMNTLLVIFSLKEQSKHEEEEEIQRPPPVPTSQKPQKAFRNLPEIPRDEPETEPQARPFLLYFC